MFAITRSVGAWEKGAVNLKADVVTVQRMLALAAQNLGDAALHPGKADGQIGRVAKESDTVKAIVAFQKTFLTNPDGLIEVNRTTWQRLLSAARQDEPAPQPQPSQHEECFPFSMLPGKDWVSAPRKYAANRSNGARAHAGCDLYFPQGTWMHAVSAGTVVRGPYPFYAETFALEVDHGGYVVRYGEIQENAPVEAGDKVVAGQKIARVGHLVGIVVPSDMLHFEMFDKSHTGPLTVTDASKSKKRADGVPFMRRKDLVDPTSFLNRVKNNLP